MKLSYFRTLWPGAMIRDWAFQSVASTPLVRQVQQSGPLVITVRWDGSLAGGNTGFQAKQIGSNAKHSERRKRSKAKASGPAHGPGPCGPLELGFPLYGERRPPFAQRARYHDCSKALVNWTKVEASLRLGR